MTVREGNARDGLLFGNGDERLVDIKCFRGDLDATKGDIDRQIQSGILQHKMHPGRATAIAPATGAEQVDLKQFVDRLSLAA